MKYGNIVLEQKDFVTLKRLLNLTTSYKEDTRKYSVKRLTEELENAIVVEEAELPKDVIRFNSVVTVATTDQYWQSTFQLVTPSESDAKNHKVSVLTPMGSAIIGYAQDDVIDWEFPVGVKSLKIVNVEQKNPKEIEL